MSSLNELDVMKIIDESLSQIEDDATKERILKWIWSKYSKEKPPTDEEVISPKKKHKKSTKKQKPKSSTNKQKSSLSIVKSLNLSPKGKKSCKEFVEEKQPKSDQEKCVVSVYHMQHNLELENIDVNHIFTCYKICKWRVPADLDNTLKVIASQKGWLDTSNGNDIKTTTHGENLVEHDLPKVTKGK